MIYFDNAATTLIKPTEVSKAVGWVVDNLGNPGRSFAPPAMDAARMIYAARRAVARLVGLDDCARVAFTSGCTEAVSLLCRTLGPGDRVVTTELEHNAVLRPIRLSGCEIDVLRCDGNGVLVADPSELRARIRPGTKFVFASHGSNLTGNLTDTAPLLAACREAGVPLALDAAQTVGCATVAMHMADILVFSGHKALFGPMGTGALVVGEGVNLPVLKTGGTGADSFSALQPAEMPDLAEAGTPNVPGISGLLAGIEFVLEIGLDAIIDHEMALTRAFYEGIAAIPGARVYGDFGRWPRLPVVSFALDGLDSAELALRLWERHGVVARAGIHCAPLLHRRFGTDKTGLLRCSFGWFNTMDEIARGVEAVREIAGEVAHG